MIPIVVSTYLADREIKNSINATRRLQSSQDILDGKVSIRNVHNKKTLFYRLGLDKEKADLLTKAAILGPIAYYLITHLGKDSRPLSRLASSLMLGGALGNWAEFQECGYATDYLRLNTGPKKLQSITFNLADAAIVLGAFLGILALLLPRKR